MAIALTTLVKIAPFDEQVKKELLSKIDSFTSDQKLELSDLAWKYLSNLYQAKLAVMVENARLDEAEGKKYYTPNDFTEMEAKLLFEFAQKLDATKSGENLQEVREKLKQQVKKPTMKPNSAAPRKEAKAG